MKVIELLKNVANGKFKNGTIIKCESQREMFVESDKSCRDIDLECHQTLFWKHTGKEVGTAYIMDMITGNYEFEIVEEHKPIEELPMGVLGEDIYTIAGENRAKINELVKAVNSLSNKEK